MRGYWLKQHSHRFHHARYDFGHTRVCDIKSWEDGDYLAKSVRRQWVPDTVGTNVTCPECLRRLVPNPNNLSADRSFASLGAELESLNEALTKGYAIGTSKPGTLKIESLLKISASSPFGKKKS